MGSTHDDRIANIEKIKNFLRENKNISKEALRKEIILRCQMSNQTANNWIKELIAMNIIDEMHNKHTFFWSFDGKNNGDNHE